MQFCQVYISHFVKHKSRWAQSRRKLVAPLACVTVLRQVRSYNIEPRFCCTSFPCTLFVVKSLLQSIDRTSLFIVNSFCQSIDKIASFYVQLLKVLVVCQLRLLAVLIVKCLFLLELVQLFPESYINILQLVQQELVPTYNLLLSILDCCPRSYFADGRSYQKSWFCIFC